MRIAICGRHDHSQGLTPWEDPSWQIWTCGQPTLHLAKRVTEHYELHNFARLVALLGRATVNSYRNDLKRRQEHEGMILWLMKPDAFFPDAKILQWERLVEEFGNRVFTSSIAWMMARAMLECAPEYMGLFGVDMSDPTDELDQQRPGVQELIDIAKQRQIEIFAPPESDIMQPPALYGLREFDPYYRKMLIRRNETKKQLAEARKNVAEWQRRVYGLEGNLEAMEYQLHIWGGAKSG